MTSLIYYISKMLLPNILITAFFIHHSLSLPRTGALQTLALASWALLLVSINYYFLLKSNVTISQGYYSKYGSIISLIQVLIHGNSSVLYSLSYFKNHLKYINIKFFFTLKWLRCYMLKKKRKVYYTYMYVLSASVGKSCQD